MTDASKNELRQKLRKLVDELVTGGDSHDEACQSIVQEVAELKAVYENDPDPAENSVIDEPANDWPAADQARPSE